MGCIWSKGQGVRCTRCHNRSGDNLSFTSDNVCQRCVNVQQWEIYKRRLAALRTESTANVDTQSTAQLSNGLSKTHIQGCTQRRQFTEIQPSLANKSQPRYTVTRKTCNTKRTIRRPTNIVKPLYGEFKCSLCKRAWSSKHTWKNMYQKCGKCGVHVYPHLQRPLLQSDKPHSDKPHPQHLCQKCVQLGYYCGNNGRKYQK